MDSNGLHYKLFHSQNANEINPFLIYKAAKNNKALIQKLRLQKKLPVHNGCVNSICWNQSGNYILSGSDDQHLCVTQAYTYEILASVRTGHRANIFSAKFLPNTGDRHVVSCSGDGMTIFTNLERPDTSLVNVFNCHFGTAYEVTTVPNDPHTFLSCGEDGTVRWFDLRVKSNCSSTNCQDDILVNCSYAVTALAVNHLMPYYMSVGCADSTVRIYDRRVLGTRALGNYLNNSAQSMVARFTVPEFENKNHRITSLCYSPDGQEMLVSYSSDYIYLFEVNDRGNQKCRQLTTNEMRKQKLSPSSSSSSRPFMKRLRVRGDWSDTGPNARPESERDQNEVPNRPTTQHTSLMQRMSDVLTRIFNSPQRQTQNSVNSNERSQSASLDSSNNLENNSSQTLSNYNMPESESNTLQNTLSHEPSSSPSNSGLTNTSQTSRDTSVASGGSLSDRLQCLEQQLVVHHQSLIDVNNEEPIVNLQYSGQGVNSGMITVETGIPTNDRVISPIDEESILSDDINLDIVSQVLPNNSRVNDEEIDFSFDRNIVNNSETDSQNESSSNFRLVDDEESIDEDNESSSVPNTGTRDRLLQSFDDVLKHLKEEREQEQAHLPNVSIPTIKQKYTGHRNARTMIKEATFWGDDYIMSGSDCGHIFVWSRYTAELIMIMEGDHHVVNCLQPHPFDPILASSGIDYDIKLWAPVSEVPFFDALKAKEITTRNEVMLEETKDTITVPASFMIRMLTSLNHLRSNRASSRWRRIGAAARAAAEHSSDTN